MKLVLDTNVYVSGIFWGGYPKRIIDAWDAGRITFVVSHAIIYEYWYITNTLAEDYKLDVAPKLVRLSVFGTNVIRPIMILPFQISRDPKDDMFVTCAIESETKLIVSGDRDLLEIPTHIL